MAFAKVGVNLMHSIDAVRCLLLAPLMLWLPISEAQEAEKGAVFYASDFSSLDDGDFPSELVFRGGGMQIDRSQGAAMLRFQGNSWFHIGLDASLPDDFVIEFDYYTNEYNAVLFVSAFDAAQSGQEPPSYSGYRQGPFNFFSIASTVVGAAIDRGSDSLPMANAQNRAFAEGVVPIRLEVRGGQARIFIDGSQVVIHPAAKLLRSDVVEFFYASAGSPGNGYIGRIRIAAL
jgi:hypothetical protein